MVLFHIGLIISCFSTPAPEGRTRRGSGDCARGPHQPATALSTLGKRLGREDEGCLLPTSFATRMRATLSGRIQ
jgi:hypothetical protein